MDDRLYPARPILAVSAAVFREGRVLVARRARAPMVGRFSLPGGVVEVGETLEEALARELEEEVGVEAEIVAFNRHVEPIERERDQCAHAFRHRFFRRPLARRRGARERRNRRRRLDRPESLGLPADDAGARRDSGERGADREPNAVRRALVAIFSATALIAAQAQTPKPAPAPPAAAKTPAPAAQPPPPYQPQLLRLAEIMGALAYLRDLCGAGDGAKFRARMAALLDAESASETERDLIAGAYNRGFENYRITYRECTPAAGEIISNFLAEMARLATEVASRYGGG